MSRITTLRIRASNLTPLHYVALWAIVRAWAVMCGFSLFPYPMREYLFSDIQLYDWWAGNIVDGHFPINDPMWQYPPLAAIVFAAGYLIAPQAIGFVFLEVLADFAVLLILLNAVKRVNHGRSYTPVLLWVVAPLIMGPVMLGRFDIFPTAIAIAALLVNAQPRSAGALAAVGGLLKVWPVLTLAGTPRKLLARTIAWFAFSFLAGSVLLRAWWPNSFGFLTEQRSRGLQIESVGALPYMVWNATSQTVTTEFRYGAIEVMAQGTGLMSLFVTACGLLLIGSLAWWRVTGKLEGAQPTDVVLSVVLIAIATSRVLSPQYMVWVLGLIAVSALYPNKMLKKVAPLMIISSALGQMMYPWLYISFQEGKWFPVAVHAVRIATLVIATLMSWNHLRKIAQASGSSPASN